MTVPSDDELLFLALGGAGEIGMNLNLYGHAGKWLMVDLGIGFADDSMPGIEVVMPDPAFIEERRKDLVGIVLTHAHEDHLGAVADLWPRLEAPVYATPFAASVLRRKLMEAGLDRYGAGHRDPARRQVQPDAVRARAHHHDAFDPRAECAGDPNQARHGVPHRRLEDRSRAAAGRS